MASVDSAGLIEVRHSNVHGLGVFATRAIAKGTRVVEYLGERVSHGEADRRYEDKDENDSHTFLFIVDSRTVIDAGVGGNDARYINHSCNPNCESVIEDGRVFIEAIRDIEPGAELSYDYQIQREADDPDNVDEIFACRCGFPQCRGTMLWPAERSARPAKKNDSGKRAARSKRGKTRRAAADRSSSSGRRSGSAAGSQRTSAAGRGKAAPKRGKSAAKRGRPAPKRGKSAPRRGKSAPKRSSRSRAKPATRGSRRTSKQGGRRR